MQREIYEVHADIVDANGTYSKLSGYPKSFDSKNYDNDLDIARQRAYGQYHEALGAMCKRDDRQLQYSYIIRVSDGIQIEKSVIGAIAPLPDPEPEPNEEPTEE